MFIYIAIFNYIEPYKYLPNCTHTSPLHSHWILHFTDVAQRQGPIDWATTLAASSVRGQGQDLDLKVTCVRQISLNGSDC
jgi:hypothetical protein